MTNPKSKTRPRKYYTPLQANRTLPLVSAIVRDVIDLDHVMHERDSRPGEFAGDAADDEGRMHGLEEELTELGVLLRDRATGRVEFRWRRGGGPTVYLSWQFGEPAVAYWHPAGDKSRLPLEA